MEEGWREDLEVARKRVSYHCAERKVFADDRTGCGQAVRLSPGLAGEPVEISMLSEEAYLVDCNGGARYINGGAVEPVLLAGEDGRGAEECARGWRVDGWGICIGGSLL